ncbi:MAG: MarR family winged helix-turn-helix transcriptional regulator [Jatrophihabitans sp.]|uniref:MarR family winged helix-turn-helix transcriptional regulator n=1 Tax=Jatrophihabitans sp. TaxID=1932789 RepID=UPI003F7DE1C5
MTRDGSLSALRALVRMSRLLEAGSNGLSLAHYRVLAAVSEGDERASHVAARLALGKPTISASVDALCKRGLLTREPNPDDQRAVALRVTQAGRAELVAAEEGMLRRLDAVLARVPDPAGTERVLAGLADALDQLAAERLGARA